VSRFTLRPHFPRSQSPLYAFCKKQAGTRNRPGCFGKNINLFFYFTGNRKTFPRYVILYSIPTFLCVLLYSVCTSFVLGSLSRLSCILPFVSTYNTNTYAPTRILFLSVVSPHFLVLTFCPYCTTHATQTSMSPAGFFLFLLSLLF
jgi:hypothetical protein